MIDDLPCGASSVSGDLFQYKLLRGSVYTSLTVSGDEMTGLAYDPACHLAVRRFIISPGLAAPVSQSPHVPAIARRAFLAGTGAVILGAPLAVETFSDACQAIRG